MTTLNEQMEKRMQERPDKQTLAWLDSRFDGVIDGYRGLTHACNLVFAEIEDQNVVVKGLRERIEVQADMLHRANAEIGQLRAEFGESMAKIREAYSELRQQIK